MASRFLNRCNGYSPGARKLTDDESQTIEVLLPEARKIFRDVASQGLVTEDIHYGHRFHDAETVKLRIASASNDGEVLKDAMVWVLDALRDCAMADHWYTFEKKWD